jgi:transposase
MYIRESKKTVKGKTYINHVLVESVATPKGPRQRAICSLGDLGPKPRADWLKLVDRIEEALVGQGDWEEGAKSEDDGQVREIVEKVRAARKRKQDGAVAETKAGGAEKDSDLVAVHTDRVTTEESREAGPVHVGVEFWKRLDLDGILERVGLDERVRRLTCAMVMNRLISPEAEYGMPEWIRQTALGDIWGMDFESLAEDALYRNLDRLYPNREPIERGLAEREQAWFGLDGTVCLYDLTSTYFEGKALGNPKAQRGYSRDHRPDCKQVVVGLVLGREGFPLAHEVFAGNTLDHQTVGPMLDVLEKRAGRRAGATVVIDRGMADENSRAEILSRGYHYLEAARQSERDRALAEFEDEAGFEPVVRTPSPTNPLQKKSHIEVKLRRLENGTQVLCKSDERVEKDRAIRRKHEGRLKADVEKLQKSVAAGRLQKTGKIWERIGRLKQRYPRVARYWDIAYDEAARAVTLTAHADKLAVAEKLDGTYLLKTDRTDLEADPAWRLYMLLTRVEAAFRSMKSPLAERPIFHHLERRVETHIFLCVLAYHILTAVEKTLLDQDIHTSWATVRKTLKTHQVTTVVLPADGGQTLRIRKSGTPDPDVRALYDILRVPHEVIRPRKTWSLGRRPKTNTPKT